jgi:hypothetical protein
MGGYDGFNKGDLGELLELELERIGLLVERTNRGGGPKSVWRLAKFNALVALIAAVFAALAAFTAWAACAAAWADVWAAWAVWTALPGVFAAWAAAFAA